MHAAPATAQVEVTFNDGAPWDIFTIAALDCSITDALLTIDLTTSAAGALIDTQYGGAGTQDPMPAELAEGNALLTPVADGDQQLNVMIASLTVDTSIVLRMDLDDTAGAANFGPRIQVYDDEISGATVTLTYQNDASIGTFDPTGVARVPLPASMPDCHMLS